MYQGNSAIHTLPTMYDLPSEDAEEMGLPDEFHDFQPDLHYGVFDRYSSQFRMFCLQGDRYVEQMIVGQGFWLPEVELGLGVWDGCYQGMAGQWLRWYDRNGEWISTAAERADLERERADRLQERATRLAAKLQELGIDPE